MAGNSISTRSYLPSIRPFHNRVEDQEVESRPFFVDNKWQINSEANLKWVQTKNKLETENELKWHLRKNSHKYIVHTSILERWTKEEDQKAILPIPNHFLCKSVISGVALYILFGAQITAISLIADLAIQGLRKLRDKDINLSNYLQLGKRLEWFKMPSSEYFKDLKKFAIIIAVANIFWGIIFKLTKVVIDQQVIHYMKDAILNRQYLRFIKLFGRVTLVAPIIEEIIFRGFLQEKLKSLQIILFKGHENKDFMIFARIFIQAVIFGSLHDPAVVFAAALMGTIFGQDKEEEDDSLLPSMLRHWTINSCVSLRILFFKA